MSKAMFSGAGLAVVVTASLAAIPSWASAQTRDDAQERRRNIRYMEGVLVQAVRVGAEQVGKELERYEPTGVTVLLGTPRARGFLIDNHGVFFDVEVPDMNQSVVWSVMMTQRDRQIGNAVDSLSVALQSMPEGAPMQQAQKALQALRTVNVSTAKDAATGAAPGGQVPAANPVLADPRKLYQDAVITSVVDAMLGYSVQMSLGPEEWLTVAARGVDAPLAAQQGLQESTTITVRVKGVDLAVYHSDPARRGEIREKVKNDAKVF